MASPGDPDPTRPSRDERRPSPAVLLALALVLALSGWLRFALVDWGGKLAARGDEGAYLSASRLIRSGEEVDYRFPRWDALHFPPLYPWLVARSGGQVRMRRLQVWIGLAVVALVFELGRRTVGARAALLAATWAAFDPTLVAFGHLILSETTFLALFLAALVFVVGPRGRPAGVPACLLGGAVLGLATLTRVLAAYAAPVLILWMALSLRSARATLPRGAALLLGLGLVLLPKTLEIRREHGGFLLVTSGSAQAWYRGYNAFPPENHDHGFGADRRSMKQELHAERKRPPVVDPNPVRFAREEARRGIEWAREHPATALLRFVQREVELLNPTSVLVRRLRTDGYVPLRGGEPLPIAPWVREGLVLLSVASTMLLLAGGFVGLLALPAGPQRALFALLVLFVMTFSGLTFAGSRYRLPLTPFLLLAAARLVVEWRAARVELRRPGRALAAGLVCAALAAAWSLHVAKSWAPAEVE